MKKIWPLLVVYLALLFVSVLIAWIAKPTINWTAQLTQVSGGFELFPWTGAVKDSQHWRILPYSLTLPPGQPVPTGDTLALKATRGEFDALSFGIKASEPLSQITVAAGNLTGPGGAIPSSALDIKVVKPWYRMNDQTPIRTSTIFLIPELLLKDDSLVKIDESKQMNFLKVTRNGSTEYMDITTPTGTKFPSDAYVQDASTLQPFDMDSNSYKQIWITIHVPSGTPAGDYTGTITVTPAGKASQVMNVNVTVLPFDLAQSLLTESIYYIGKLTGTSAVDETNKSPAQLAIELANLRDHGITNPAIYQWIETLGNFLEIMKSAGLSTNHLYWLGDITGNYAEPDGSYSASDLDRLKTTVANLINIASAHGFHDPYIYGIDEVSGDALRAERPAWQAVHEAGGKVFVAGYDKNAFGIVGDILDIYNYNSTSATDFIPPEQPALWHSTNRQVFSYGLHSGAQNPDLYRRYYGVPLLLAGYDGAMNWAYQSATSYPGNIWNNFEDSRYGGLSITYPTSNGVVDTVNWEGYREGVNDVRYLSTLVQMDKTRTKNQIFTWAKGILAANPDLDSFRQTVIAEILRVITPTCGDGTCNGSETCSSCPADCGVCPCTPNWSCGSWSTCADSHQTRTCTDSNDCGVTTGKPTTSQSCTSTCTPNWSCGSWSTCANSQQTRPCTDSNDCGVTTGKPTTSQSCTSPASPAVEPDITPTPTAPTAPAKNSYCSSNWKCYNQGICENSKQVKKCIDSNKCSASKTIVISCAVETETQLIPAPAIENEAPPTPDSFAPEKEINYFIFFIDAIKNFFLSIF